jgi:hypothetical protein
LDHELSNTDLEDLYNAFPGPRLCPIIKDDNANKLIQDLNNLFFNIPFTEQDYGLEYTPLMDETVNDFKFVRHLKFHL